MNATLYLKDDSTKPGLTLTYNEQLAPPFEDPHEELTQ